MLGLLNFECVSVSFGIRSTQVAVNKFSLLATYQGNGRLRAVSTDIKKIIACMIFSFDVLSGFRKKDNK